MSVHTVGKTTTKSDFFYIVASALKSCCILKWEKQKKSLKIRKNEIS